MKPSSAAVLDLLRRRPFGVTALEALTEAGTFRLAARVADLKAAGFVIRTEMVRTTTGKSVARYVLEEQTSLGLVG